MNFLVVDDSKISRKKLIEFIQTLGFNVVGEAEDGLEAIEKFKELNPTHITIDLEMPNMSGIDASKEILTLSPDTNIILVTSIINKVELISAIKSGVRDVLTKPVTIEAFKKALDKIENN